MKILYIVPDITDSGGISRVVSLKTNYLVSQLNYEVRILSVNDCFSKPFYDFDSAIKWYNFKNSKKGFLYLKRYISFIKETITNEKPDIIVVCDAVLWLFIPWFIKTEIPVIFETHVSISLKKILNSGLHSIIRTEIVCFFKKITLKKFDRFIVLSESSKKEWNLVNSKVIPNPISFVSQNLAVLDNKKAIAICRHSYEKGVDRLLLIWKKVLKHHPDWVLEIYGQWDSDLHYQSMAESLDISKNVNFIAPTHAIWECYNHSSILLMTSRSEVFPMVLIEAMVCGLPCVAYNCPIGPTEIIVNNQNGYLIEDGNQDLFVEKINQLIENKSLRLEIGKKANESIKKYNIDKIMTKWNELFIDILSNKT